MKVLHCLILQRSHNGSGQTGSKKKLQRINMYTGMDHINVNTFFGICHVVCVYSFFFVVSWNCTMKHFSVILFVVVVSFTLCGEKSGLFRVQTRQVKTFIYSLALVNTTVHLQFFCSPSAFSLFLSLALSFSQAYTHIHMQYRKHGCTMLASNRRSIKKNKQNAMHRTWKNQTICYVRSH